MSKQYCIRYQVIQDAESKFFASFTGYLSNFDHQPAIYQDINQAYRVAYGWQMHWIDQHVAVQVQIEEDND